MVDPETSFEVRKQLERIQQKLPPREPAPVASADAEEVDRLIEQLGDDSYARRLGSESRLLWLLGNSESAELIYQRVKRIAADAQSPRSRLDSLKGVYEAAREGFSGPAGCGTS